MHPRAQLAAAALALTAVAAWMFREVLGCASACLVDMHAIYDPSHPLYLLYRSDSLLNSWALGWIHHALLTPGAGVFQGNAFYPAAYALTGSEHMLGIALPLLPLSLFGVNAVRIHQLALFAAFLGTALATLALVRWLTRSTGFAFVAGLAALVMPWRITELAHVQLEGTPWLVLSWLFLARSLDAHARAREFVLLALCLAGALLSSYYLAWYALASAVILTLVLGIDGRGGMRGLVGVGLATCTALVALAAATWSYLMSHAPEILDSAVRLTPGLQGAWRNVAPRLAGERLLERATDYRLPLSVAVFAAATPLLLLQRERERNDRGARPIVPFALALAAICVTAFVLSAGSDTRVGDAHLRLPGYWLAQGLPGYAAMRATARWAILIGLAAPILAVLVAHTLVARLRCRGHLRGTASNALLLGAASLWILCDAPLRTIPAATPLPWMQPGTDLHAVYAELARLPPGPVVEIPAPGRSDWEAESMHASTLHWFPTIHGYSRYEPPLQQLMLRVARDLPARAAVDDLRRLIGARWVVVHWARLSAEMRTRWQFEAGNAGLATAFGSQTASLYEIPPGTDSAIWLAALLDPQTRATTLTGLPRTRLDPANISGTLAAGGPATVWPDANGRARIDLTLRIANDGDRAWPSLDMQRDGLVAVRITPVDQAGQALEPRFELLGRDVAAGARVTTTAVFRDRLAAGRYMLRVELVQLVDDGSSVALPIEPAIVAVDVRSEHTGG